MKQYETIKMTPKKAVNVILRGKHNCTPEVWKSAEQMIRTLGENATEKKVVLRIYWRCPVCDARVNTSDSYCRECGQAIKW